MDQTDRYRGVEQLAATLRAAMGSVPDAALFLNADDPRVAFLAEGLPNRKRWFGSDVALSRCVEHDGTSCPRCGADLSYGLRTLGHLGHWSCPSCGLSRPEPDVRIADFRRADYLECDIAAPGGTRTYRVAHGQSALLHNVAAAHILWSAVDGNPDELAVGITGHSALDARWSTVTVHGCTFHLEMVKNAIGANVAIDRFACSDAQVTLLLGLGRRQVDSCDSSWIWNADFERLAACAHRIGRIYVMGAAGNAVVARLVCAGIPRDIICPVEDPRALREVCERESEVYCLCSGSVMRNVGTSLARMRKGGAKRP